MKAIILVGTLKKDTQSNTRVLSEFFAEKLRTRSIECEIVQLVEHTILPGTQTNMGDGDDWPDILDAIISSDIIILATPIWWGNYSSEIQKVIERLDAVHDEILTGKKSLLHRKVGGIIITGDYDGAQHIIGMLNNFYNALGILIPPYASLSALWQGHKKGTKTSREDLLEKYHQDYSKTAEKMIDEMTHLTHPPIVESCDF